jgi:hypothetical protein
MTETGRDPEAAPRSAVVEALAASVAQAGSRGLALEQILGIAQRADPDLAAAADARVRILVALEQLVSDGVARPWPTRRDALDRRATPPLPLLVRPARTERGTQPNRPSLPVDLRPELESARGLERLRADEIATLRAVNAFLRDHGGARPVVPSRERSLELFGDEKRLDALVSQRLFSAGVLSLELLECYEVHPPFVFERVSDAPVLLVIENHHTYDSARRLLAVDPRGIGVVAYGAGRAICSSVAYAADLDPGVTRIYYFGDLDEAGLAIAASTSLIAVPAGLPALEPAVGLYRALLASPYRRVGAVVDAENAEARVAWLPSELRSAAVALLTGGTWVPQEAVSLEVLAGLSDWVGE